MALRAASDAGQPIVARDPDGPLGRIYKDIAQTMLDGLDDEKAGLAPRKI
jgi:hypothetical protein